MPRLLYVLPGLVEPPSNPAHNALKYLSEIAEGEVLLPVWWRSRDNAPISMRTTFPVYRIGNFRYHFLLTYRYPKHFRRVARLLFYLYYGLQLHREQKFDVILTYGTNIPGIVGVILKWFTGAKLIVEIPGVPENAFRFDAPNPGRRAKLKRLSADVLLNIVGTAADCIRLFYPWQLKGYPRLRKKKVAVFHAFVPVNAIAAQASDDKFVLSLGYPWYTKGIDILIRAFVSITPRFPNFKLKLMGHYPDRNYLDQLTQGCPQIEFVRPSLYDIALETIASCSVFVLASRTDAGPRVLLEAMAARKPIIASSVGGIPHYIHNEDNGLLFESENVDELAAKLTAVLSSADLSTRLANRGYERVMTEYDENSFVQSFKGMLRSIEQTSEESDRCGGAIN